MPGFHLPEIPQQLLHHPTAEKKPADSLCFPDFKPWEGIHPPLGAVEAPASRDNKRQSLNLYWQCECSWLSRYGAQHPNSAAEREADGPLECRVGRGLTHDAPSANLSTLLTAIPGQIPV
jgi:hypothetical protein